MNALLLLDRHKLELKEIPNPQTSEDEMVVEVQVSGIGGSEYLGYNNTGIRPLPNIMGHSIAGTLPNGKRVVIYPLLGCETCEYCQSGLAQLCDSWKLIGVQLNGGFAQKVSVPKQSIFEIPDSISWEQSSFIEPFANSINAWELSKAELNHSILIIGAGSLGLGLVACASKFNHKNTTIIEQSKPRKLAALELGVKAIDKDFTGLFDIVFDTVGSKITRNLAIGFVKKNGQCVFLGFAEPLQELNFSVFIRKQFNFIGSFVYSRQQFENAIELSKLSNTNWVKNLTFDEVETQLCNYLADNFTVIKAVLRPNS